MKKVAESSSSSVGGSSSSSLFGQDWHQTLCEYMMTQQTPYVRRQVRKLLLYACGSKEKYRELRDLHTLGSHMAGVRAAVEDDLAKAPVDGPAAAAAMAASVSTSKAVVSFPYDTLLTIIEHLKACVDVASSRTQNWQKFCLQKEDVITFLFQISFILDEGVSPIVLQLLQSALCTSSLSSQQQQPSTGTSSSSSRKAGKSSSSPSKRSRGEKSKTESTDETRSSSSVFGCDESLTTVLVRKVHDGVTPDMLSRFVEKFLLECNSTAVRWQAHSLVVTVHRNSTPAQKEQIVDVLWKLWHRLPAHGRKAAQFVDLLGYFSMKTLKDERKIAGYIQKAVDILKDQNAILSNHPNSNMYEGLGHLVEFNG